MRRLGLILGLLLLVCIPLQAQDGLNLPTELYILLNEGAVERYGLGVAGVQRVSASDQFVVDFGVAPDGNWMAYRTPEGLFLKNMFTDELRQIEGERASLPDIRGRGETLAWTANSDALAYTTEYGGRVAFLKDGAFADVLTPGLLNLSWSPDGQYLAAEALENVWWIFARQGTEMVLTGALPGARGIGWVTSSRLVYPPTEGGLTVIDLKAGNQPTVLLAPDQQYHFPYVMENGHIRIFAGEADSARLHEVFGAEGGMQVAEIGTGNISLTGIRWAPEGRLLIQFDGGALALYDPISGSNFTLPIASAAAYSWGASQPQAVTGTQLPMNGYFLAPDNNGIVQAWRLPADSSLPVTITPATLDVTEFAISPDDSRIVYVSNGSLWAFAFGTEAPAVQLVELGLNGDITPAWTPDSNAVYYRDSQEVGEGIWRFSFDTLQAERFLGNTAEQTYSHPQLAHGVGAMVVTVNGELWMVDTASGNQTALGIVGKGKWMAGTEFMAQGNSSRGPLSGDGLFSYDANNLEADPAMILPLLGDLQLLDYQALENGIVRLLVQATTPGQVQIMDVSRDGNVPTLIGSAGYMLDPALSPSGTAIVGYSAPGDGMIVYDLASNTRYLIDALSQVTDFVWQQ